VLLRPNAAETYHGFKKPQIKIGDPTIAAGKKVYEVYGCVACHTTDGGKNHGPTFKALAGSERQFPGHGAVVADEVDHQADRQDRPGLSGGDDAAIRAGPEAGGLTGVIHQVTGGGVSDD
jgi:CxxC motif-containing protein (DUF1111 family)